MNELNEASYILTRTQVNNRSVEVVQVKDYSTTSISLDHITVISHRFGDHLIVVP